MGDGKKKLEANLGGKRKFEKKMKVVIDGEECTVLGDALTDMRTVYLMGKVADDSLPDMKKIQWYMCLLDKVFAEPVLDLMDRLAENRGGHLEADDFAEFFGKVLEEVGAKN